jgi:hypothetical protein
MEKKGGGGEIEGNRKLDGSRQNNHRDDIYTRRRYTRAVLTGGKSGGLPWRGTDSSSGNLRSKAKEKKKKKTCNTPEEMLRDSGPPNVTRRRRRKKIYTY